MDRTRFGIRVGRVRPAHRFMVVEDGVQPMRIAGKRVHLIGIGGIGMSGLAQMLVHCNAIVTGSDQVAGPMVSYLASKGIQISIGHRPENIPENVDMVVMTAAVRSDNPELVRARQLGCPIYKYAQMLGLLMNRYHGIAISGTHGKSTTTGWLSFLLRRAGIDVNFVVGAVVGQLGGSSGVGQGHYFVAEACEYDRSFLNLRPTMAAVLNIEPDHLDYYKDLQEIVDAFGQFIAGVAFEGTVVANGQDPCVHQALAALRPDVECVTFGLDERCSFYATDLELVDGLYNFNLWADGRNLGRTHICLPGKHNVMNALAVSAMAMRIGVPGQTVLRLLPEFLGVERRLSIKGLAGGVTILDDYAHHPTEIKASLEAIRQRYRPSRLWCVFQPHQHSRTRFLLEEFAQSFGLADVTVVPQIYFVRDSEQTRQTVNSQMLVERIHGYGSQAVFIDGFEAICDYLAEHVVPGDLVVTMGAGDIWKVADVLVQRLGADSKV
ncbi:MAG: UDP-N-acetylmuramate--L-alanine ligase [Sedimentisphaerales bacterium]|nr:UDP-N-acetylmuramate--L-alanine ligase [Sedimentisphaerales bacterium]